MISVGFLNSVKSHFSKEDSEEQDFERAFREGRFPEGVDDFEPLSNTGSFVAAGLEPEEQPAFEQGQPDPFAEPAPGAYVDGYSAGTPRPDLGDEGVQVVERVPGAQAPLTGAVKPEPFAARLRARVAAANVAGQDDGSLGRSKFATDAQNPVPPSAARPQKRADVGSDELEAELAERRRARSERVGAPALHVVSDDPKVADAEGRTFEIAARAEAAAKERAQAKDSAPEAKVAEKSAERPPLKPLSLPTSAIVLRPRLYDDVKDVAEGVVSKHQPVILILRGSSAEVARRTLDFSFGLCCGIQAEMRQLGERVYAIVPRGTEIADADLTTLRHQGVIRG